MKKEVLVFFAITFLVVACGSTQSNDKVSLSKNLNKTEPASNEYKEGWVTLSFDITETGTTANIKVLDSSPPKVFDGEAIKALSRWKYKPEIIDGVPVRQTNQKVQLDFKLQENGN